MDTKILIIDDDRELGRLLKDCLKKEFIQTELSYDGMDGLKKLKENAYQLIVLDIMLPKKNGFDVLSELRHFTKAPVLMLSARNEEVDKVSGLRLGADDYLTKPFGINEFTARVQSLIRRCTQFNAPQKKELEPIAFPPLFIDREKRIVTLNGENIVLTGKEFDVLILLASNAGKVFTKKQIYNAVWKEEYAFDDSNIMSYMSKLRKKLSWENREDFIQTVWGVGYRFHSGVDL